MRKRALLAVAAVLVAAAAAAAVYRLRRPGRPAWMGKLAGPYYIINAHEHIQDRKSVPKLLAFMDQTSIEATVLAAGSRITTVHPKKYGFDGYDENSREVIEIARRWPGRFIPFVTLKPGDAGNEQKLARWVGQGARGLKLYTGHSTFHELKEPDGTTRTVYPLDHPSMMPVYAWAEAHDLPLLWHVNTGLYLDEFERVMARHPNLLVICPHHCMAVGRPEFVADLMRRYPRLWIDLSHGYHEYMASALAGLSAKRDGWRRVYQEFSDRLLWGTDVVITPKKQKTVAWIQEMARAYFGLLGDATFTLPYYDKNYRRTRTQRLPGMALPPPLLKKIYQDNPHRLFRLDHAH